MSSNHDESKSDRRDFLRKGSLLVAGTTALGYSVPAVHAAENNTIRLALIGCGDRGTGAVANALNTSSQGPIKLFAMADLHDTQIESKLVALREKYPESIDVSDDRKFLGFDAYKKAIDVLKPGDVAMCTTRAYIRPVHVEYAVSKGINVFMEKPFATDPRGLQRMLRAGEEAEAKWSQDRRGTAVSALAGASCTDRQNSATVLWANSPTSARTG